ncbi:MAG: transketolase family protein [Clostridia bacterium]|nr:transketolase family protein [Clostridia bacterium]MBQ4618580.1 transketolase family protein [Clostridia bacterium]MBQ9856059.1 transketolase family protein [Clostridia bacterium]
MKAARKAITETLLELGKKDKRIFALATDSRGSVTLGDFVKELPEQFVECGIAEQDAVGIAAGLACTGLIPFVCGPASFYSTRAAEQVKVDMAYSHTNVKVIGVSGGVSYGALGGTHHAVQDVALMRAIPGLQVILPADANSASAMTRALACSKEPAYIRVGRGDVEDIYPQDVVFEIGKAIKLSDGKDAAIIACGEMVAPAVKACEMLKEEGIFVKLFDMHTIKPMDVDAVMEAASTGLVVTVEEHSVYGGLGSAVSEYLSQNAPVRMKIMGLPDETLYSGTNKQVFEHYGLTSDGIAQTIRKGLMK